MIKFSLYDFDRTIYSKDTGIEILKTIFKIKPLSLLLLPKMFFSSVGCACKIINSHSFKESVFSPISLFSKEEWSEFIHLFWVNQQKLFFPQVLEQIQQDKKNGYTVVIISASAEVMLYPILETIPADFLIGTQFYCTENCITSKIIGKNCKNQEKVNRFYSYVKEHFPNQDYSIEKMYSDSLHDLPLFEIAKEKYTVEKDGSIRLGLPKPNKNL